MSWLAIFLTTAKWVTAIWASLVAFALLGCAVLVLVFALGSRLAGGQAEREGQDSLCRLP
jgi:hypothetical protein